VYHDLYYCTQSACLVWCCDPKAVDEGEDFTNIWWLEFPKPRHGCQHPLKLEATRRLKEFLRQILK